MMAAQRGARMALTITGWGFGDAGGFVLLGQMAGTYQIDQLVLMKRVYSAASIICSHSTAHFIRCIYQSAIPISLWLPNAMAAPTPVSAYLHSATMVKAGIFLLARLAPFLLGQRLYHNIVTFVGLFTLCMAAGFAIFKEDLKGLLAYSTISHLGLIVCLLGIGLPLAVAAAIFISLIMQHSKLLFS